jgi:hypothetical protein
VNLESWFTLPTPEWAGSLVGLALAIVSAAAAVYASAHTAWVAELEAAVEATVNDQGEPRGRKTAEGARAYANLKKVRSKDPSKSLGRVALMISGLMTVIGVIAGLQIPKVGLLYTVIPVLVAAGVSLGAVFVPGRSARRDADAQISLLTKAAPEAAG